MLTAHQYRNSWYTLTRPELDGPIRVLIGFDKRMAQKICVGLWDQGAYCVVGFGFQHDLIGEQ